MREDEIISTVISELDSITAVDVDVRTEGGDGNIDPPEIILGFDSTRLDGENGHVNRGGWTTDSNGNKTGYEFHIYYLMTVDCMVRSINEGDAHDLLALIQDHFSPFEYESDWFHADTAEWRVGDVSPRNNPVMEPDWYQFGVPIRFKYVRKVTKSADTLTSVPTTVDEESDTLDDGEIIIETKD